MPFQIAIDGPVASGKGTVARLLAERLHFLYIDTGAMYRVMALLALRNHVPFQDEAKIVELLTQAKIEVRQPLPAERDGRLSTVLLNGEDVSWQIRTEEVGSGSSQVAVLPNLRKGLVARQQEIAADQSVIMEGRDITFRVLPQADLKIYLTADAKKRAERRYEDLLRRGEDVPFETVYTEVKARDARDMGRAADPLQIKNDVWVLDSTNLTIEEVVEKIVQRVHELRAKK